VPSWSEYAEIARNRGAFALQLFVVESRPVAAPQDMQAVLPDHLAYQKHMEAEGRLVLAGPLSDETGKEMSGAGLIIYRAASISEARSLAEADPMHARGMRSFTVRAWLVNEGSLNVSVKLSSQALDRGI